MTLELQEKLAKIKLIAFDFDGIFTDGHVYFREDGKETVRCSRRDSLGLNMLQKAGIYACVISKEANPVVSRRCEKIGIPCFQKVADGEGKRAIFERVMKDNNISKEASAFMGDDVNDIPAMRFAGVAFTVADGHDDVLKIADYATRRSGGNHAIREICDMILTAKNIPVEY